MAKARPMRDGAETRVLVEFVPGPRVPGETITDATGDQMSARSQHSLETALDQIRQVVERVASLQAEMPANLKQMQVDFGIKLDWEAGALLANDRSEASIAVKLTWDRNTAPEGSGLPALAEQLAEAASEGVPITPSGLIQSIGVEPGEPLP